MRLYADKVFKTVFLGLVLGLATTAPASAPVTGGGPILKITKDDLLEWDNFYVVKGVVYNPNGRPVKNVRINYFIWKKWMGKDGHGSVIKETGGLVSATINYIPPRQSVEFTAEGGDSAPVMTPESGLLPDPIKGEISAEWDR